MSFFEDYQSSQASFQGDPTGAVFDAPEVNLQSSGTKRVVDTQSGFLVVVKKLGIGKGLSLSVKRQLGTPPTSSISLTPDETRQLSKTLLTLLGEPENFSDQNQTGARLTKLDPDQDYQEIAQLRAARRKQRNLHHLLHPAVILVLVLILVLVALLLKHSAH